MLTLSVLSCLFSFLVSSSYLLLRVLFILLFYYFLQASRSFFLSSITVSSPFTSVDTVSLFMSCLLFLVLYLSYIVAFSSSSPRITFLVFVALFIFCYSVFTTSHLFLLYFYYEASLVPILFIIIKWGSYPERSLRAIIILAYTLIFGAPVLILIIYYNISLGTWYIPIINSNGSFFVRFILFLCFSVKLPIYGLHFWLPIAHVEAPTYGSVILASVLLKLGGVGLLRLEDVINISSFKDFLLSYFMVFILFSSIVCCYQSDFKRLIAYSSVAHMIVVPFLIFSNNYLSLISILLVIFLHGLSSTLMFLRVGYLYLMYSTRQLVLIRGLLLLSPLFRFCLVLTFLFTLSAPPFPSYVAEVFFFLSSFFLSSFFLYVILLFAFLSLVYNLNWLSSVLFSSPRSSLIFSSFFLSYRFFLCSSLALLEMLPVVLLFYFF